MAPHQRGRTTGSRRLYSRVAAAASGFRTDLAAALLDAVLTASSFLILLVLRFDGAVPGAWWDRSRTTIVLGIAVSLLANAVVGLYGQIWAYASMLEAQRLTFAGLLSFVTLELSVLAGGLHAPQSIVVLGPLLATLLHGAVRFRTRLFAYQSPRRQTGLRVVLLGAGRAGSVLARDMLSDPRRGVVPVAFLDDDPRLHGRSLHGIRVFGSFADLITVVHELEAHQVVLAVSDPEQDVVRTISTLAEDAGVTLRVIPRTDELSGDLGVQDVRDLRIDDLLGREQVPTDLEAVRALVAGRRVLVTGAGGSIGSEIARQVAECAPEALFLLDNDETHLHDCAATLGSPATQLLVDIRELHVIERAFTRAMPDIVFHAAAHKHVPLLEAHPSEAVKTNVLGTSNVVAAARAAGVERFIFISTDKAVRPSSVMGASKAVGEQIVLSAATSDFRATAVRFGNVLGSRGSVIPTFMKQIQAGGPVTITHAAMTRYFMSIPEAVQLVLQAATMTTGGEVFMLEMGEPVKILDLAQNMIRLSGRRVGDDIELRITGMRPGEKLVEELHAPEELTEPTAHPSVLKLCPELMSRADLKAGCHALTTLASTGFDASVRTGLFAMARRQTWVIEGSVQLPERRRRSRDPEWVEHLVTEGAVWTPSAT